MAMWESLNLRGHQCVQPMVRNMEEMSHNFGFRQVNKPYDQKCESYAVAQREKKHKFPKSSHLIRDNVKVGYTT